MHSSTLCPRTGACRHSGSLLSAPSRPPISSRHLALSLLPAYSLCWIPFLFRNAARTRLLAGLSLPDCAPVLQSLRAELSASLHDSHSSTRRGNEAVRGSVFWRRCATVYHRRAPTSAHTAPRSRRCAQNRNLKGDLRDSCPTERDPRHDLRLCMRMGQRGRR